MRVRPADWPQTERLSRRREKYQMNLPRFLSGVLPPDLRSTTRSDRWRLLSSYGGVTTWTRWSQDVTGCNETRRTAESPFWLFSADMGDETRPQQPASGPRVSVLPSEIKFNGSRWGVGPPVVRRSWRSSLLTPRRGLRGRAPPGMRTHDLGTAAGRRVPRWDGRWGGPQAPSGAISNDDCSSPRWLNLRNSCFSFKRDDAITAQTRSP